MLWVAIDYKVNAIQSGKSHAQADAQQPKYHHKNHNFIYGKSLLMISLSKISINFNADSTLLLFNSRLDSWAHTASFYLQHHQGQNSGTDKTLLRQQETRKAFHFERNIISTLLVELLSSETNNNNKAIANARQTTAPALMFISTKEY